MIKLLLAALLLINTAAWAQNPQCPTRPAGDSTNACASTAFVQSAITHTPLAHTHIYVGNASNQAFDFGSLATFSDVGTLAISPIAGANPGFNITQTGPSSVTAITSSLYYNKISVVDGANIQPAGQETVGLLVDMGTQGPNSAGAKYGTKVQLTQTGPDDLNRNPLPIGDHVAAISHALIAFNGGGTALTSKGTNFGGYSSAQAFAGATYFLELSGLGVASTLDAGATVDYHYGIGIEDGSTGHGLQRDVAFNITARAGWYNAIFLENALGTAALDSTVGCVICTNGAATIAKGIDLSPYTITSALLKGPNNFIIDGSGSLSTSGSLSVTDGTVVGFMAATSLFTHSLNFGTSTNHNLVFSVNNTIAGYIDASTKALNLGIMGTGTGVLNLRGTTSGVASLTVPSIAGTPTITLGSSSGTPAVTATAPLAISTTTGNITCATCVTSAASLTSNLLMIGAGSQASAVTTTGTGVLTALGINVGSAGAFVTFNGAGGTPSSITLTNATGTAASLTAGNATNTAITDDTATNATMFPTWVTANTGNLPQKVTSTKLTYNPFSGALNVLSGGISLGSATLNQSSVCSPCIAVQGASSSRGSIELVNSSTGTAGVAGSIHYFNGSTRLGSFDVSANGATNTGIIQLNVANAGSVSTYASLDFSMFSLLGPALGINKVTASGTAPGAGKSKFEVVAGTVGSSCKLIMYAGTSGTATTVIDNVGTGC